MRRKNILAFIALVAVFVLAMAGCGSEKAPETTVPETTAAPAPLGVSEWKLTATTWSSPNGATVNLTATPFGYIDGRTATFTVRLEGEEVANSPCEWDGTHYTASVELNAADGYCYYVLMADADGNSAEVPINTPAELFDEALINMETSLQSYCNLLVEESTFADGKLSITNGSIEVQLPKITNEGETISCDKAVLVLTYNGEELDTQELTLNATADAGAYELQLTDTVFDVPEMEMDQQLTLRLDVTLSNGQTLTTLGGTWLYGENGALPVVG